MKYSFIAAALLISGALAIPVAQSGDDSSIEPPDGLPMDAYDLIADSPKMGAPLNDDPDPITTSYTQTAAETAAATAVTAAIADGISTVIDAPAASLLLLLLPLVKEVSLNVVPASLTLLVMDQLYIRLMTRSLPGMTIRPYPALRSRLQPQLATY